MGRIVGTVVLELAFYQCIPGSKLHDSTPIVNCWLFGSLLRQVFFPGYSVHFSNLSKTNV